MNETKAIKLCLDRRDAAGFEYLVKHYRQQAMRHAWGWMGNREDAADACQDAFRKAFQAMPRLAELERFYPWFYSILRNHCLNLLSRKRTAVRGAEQLKVEEALQDSIAPQQSLERAEEEAEVHAALGRLKTEFREILVLKYFSEYSYEEISQVVGISRGTVMSRLYYARKAFKRELETMEGES
ncbi:RNA polymerase sigma factor, sigma-70 family [Verrucomicrobiia bacterium DG1235]|nr:RNA polymerase sigma factor, sigma-70 family [Verrucomicrobiae bacterium DG1235]